MSIQHVPKDDDVYYCGREIKSFDWKFTGIEHARNCIERNTYVQPCKKCMKSIDKGGDK